MKGYNNNLLVHFFLATKNDMHCRKVCLLSVKLSNIIPPNNSIIIYLKVINIVGDTIVMTVIR